MFSVTPLKYYNIIINYSFIHNCVVLKCYNKVIIPFLIKTADKTNNWLSINVILVIHEAATKNTQIGRKRSKKMLFEFTLSEHQFKYQRNCINEVKYRIIYRTVLKVAC